MSTVAQELGGFSGLAASDLMHWEIDLLTSPGVSQSTRYGGYDRGPAGYQQSTGPPGMQRVTYDRYERFAHR